MGRQILDKKTWTKLRTDINGSYDYSENWGKVKDLFQQRIQDFYFAPIDDILKTNKQKGEGFSILTLQCALIEMFAAFRVGKIHNRNKPRTGGLKYEYSSSSSCFVDFLQTEEIFKNHFFVIDDNGVKQPNQPFNANQFYDRVRCGLMHEARTKKDWLITSALKDSSKPKQFITENKTENTKSVNRTLLQNELKNYFDKYLQELKTTDENGNKFRRLLARKLDHLYDIPKDKKYDWWLDK